MTSPSRTWTSRHGRHLWLLVFAAAAGCASTSKTDALESQLRQQEDLLSSYQAQLDRAKTELDVAKRESANLRTQLSGGRASTVAAEHLEASFQAANVAFSSLMTGGTDIDGQPGDDGLVVVLVPQDPSGELVKVPGTVDIEAFDLSHPSGAKRIGHWQFDAGESQQHWHKGVIQSGYQFQLPWQQLPNADEVLLHGRLIAPDGRQFDTTHTVRIDPPTTAIAKGERPVDVIDTIEKASVDVKHGAAQPVTGAEQRVPSSSLHGSLESRLGSGGNAPLRSRRDTGAPAGTVPADRRAGRPPFVARGAAAPADRDAPPPLPSHRRPTATSHPRSALSTADPWNGAFDQAIPPPIQDVPEDATQPLQPARHKPLERRPVRTSDVWTDESLPYRR